MVVNMKITVSWDVVLRNVSITLVIISQTTRCHIPEEPNFYSIHFSQGLTVGPYPEPVKSSPYPQTLFL
jgi:hypothetical protein